MIQGGDQQQLLQTELAASQRAGIPGVRIVDLGSGPEVGGVCLCHLELLLSGLSFLPVAVLASLGVLHRDALLRSATSWNVFCWKANS